MRIDLHIGLEAAGAARIQHVLAEKRDVLRRKGVLFPSSPGNRNHTRLFMALSDTDHIDPLRFNRGIISSDTQTGLRDRLAQDLQRDIGKDRPDLLILSASQLAESFYRKSELQRLKAFLGQFSNNIRVVSHVDASARMAVRNYVQQVREGRAHPISRDLSLCDANDWWQTSINELPSIDPLAGQFIETQGAPFWLDLLSLRDHWGQVFGHTNIVFRPYDADTFYEADITEEIRAAFDIAPRIGRSSKTTAPKLPSAASVERARQLNELILRLLAKRGHLLPRKLWHRLQDDIEIPGPVIDETGLDPITRHFAEDARSLAKLYPALKIIVSEPSGDRQQWSPPDPCYGFRASQYLAAFMPRINRITREQAEARAASLAQLAPTGDLRKRAAPARPSPEAEKIMPPLAIQNYARLNGSAYAPHNRMGGVEETTDHPAFHEHPSRSLKQGSSGRVIVGCMKNEAPYILEWVAYHRAIGFDNFLIYTNGCTDHTDDILKRLQKLGILQHRNNDDWRGKSPQQFALNQSLKEPVIRTADWVAHIDVDEFINIRCGNGTLDDLFSRVPDATNIAMTWRLFG